MKKLIFLISLFGASKAQAIFQEIWHGYLQSEENQINLLDKKINDSEFAVKDNIFNWNFKLGGGYERSNLASLFSFQTQKTVTNSTSLSLSKVTYKYGQFQLTHDQRVHDVSKWTNRTFLLPTLTDTLYEVRNALSYSYDFFNRITDYDFEINYLERDQKQLQNQLEQQRLRFNFFQAYLQAKIDVYTVKITKEFMDRAQTRVDTVARRVRDGLSRKVDLLQARASLLDQQGGLSTARSSLRSSLAAIENILKKPIPESYFIKLTWVKRPISQWSLSSAPEKSLDVKLVEKNLERVNKELAKLEAQDGVKLDLTASYITNAVTDSASESLEMANHDREHYSQALQLTLTIPLGMDKKNALKQQMVYTKKRSQLELQRIQGDEQVAINTLLSQISLLDQAHQLALEKVEIARQTLEQQTQLYFRGQSTFEEVIRADEYYLSSQLNEKKLMAQFEQILAKYALTINELDKFLNQYQD